MKWHNLITTFVLSALLTPVSMAADKLPSAIYTDPPVNTEHPARMEVLRIPSGDVKLIAPTYLAAGAGTHPTMVLLHGFPGNEKNLDLAQAVRRAGWNVVTFNYRGSWGTPGQYSLVHSYEDVNNVLNWLMQSENAAKYGIDKNRVVLSGHSMGGAFTAHAGSKRGDLAGIVLISPANLGPFAKESRDTIGGALERELVGGIEPLSGASAVALADEILAVGEEYGLAAAVSGLGETPVLLLEAERDTSVGSVEVFADSLKAEGNAGVEYVIADTDHSWSDKRVFLTAAVIGWLAKVE